MDKKETPVGDGKTERQRAIEEAAQAIFGSEAVADLIVDKGGEMAAMSQGDPKWTDALMYMGIAVELFDAEGAERREKGDEVYANFFYNLARQLGQLMLYTGVTVSAENPALASFLQQAEQVIDEEAGKRGLNENPGQIARDIQHAQETIQKAREGLNETVERKRAARWNRR